MAGELIRNKPVKLKRPRQSDWFESPRFQDWQEEKGLRLPSRRVDEEENFSKIKEILNKRRRNKIINDRQIA